MIRNLKTYTILFGISLLLAVALLMLGSGLISTMVVFALVCASGFGFVAHLLFNLKGGISTSDENSKEASEQIQVLRNQIDQQEQNNALLEKTKERYRYEALHDPLTKLPNRKKFLGILGEWLNEEKRDNKFHFTVLAVDLNRFKTINESLGHSSGDSLIHQVSERLRNSVRQKDIVARFGGDEFGILLHNVSNLDEITACVEIIVRSLREPFEIDSREIYTSARVGAAIINEKYECPQDILRDADIAIDEAKSTEKDFVVFDPAIHTKSVNLLQVETDLRHAIEREEFVTYFQPIVSLKSMKLVGFESLIRWKHPERGMVPPGDFIGIAEHTNLIIPITLWILRNSCEQLVAWNKRFKNGEELLISVNLSGKHFAQEDLVIQIKKILKETGMNPKNLKLELTESAIMDNAESAIFMLKRLRDLGVKLSIDDFGTGYSSLSYLHRFPINTLKVDRSFVSTMEDGSENGEIVRTVISLAGTLHLDVVAEGIETVHQLHQLRILNCEYGQGYLFSAPVPLAKADEMVSDTAQWQNILPSMPSPAKTEIVQPAPASPNGQSPIIQSISTERNSTANHPAHQPFVNGDRNNSHPPQLQNGNSATQNRPPDLMNQNHASETNTNGGFVRRDRYILPNIDPNDPRLSENPPSFRDQERTRESKNPPLQNGNAPVPKAENPKMVRDDNRNGSQNVAQRRDPRLFPNGEMGNANADNSLLEL